MDSTIKTYQDLLYRVYNKTVEIIGYIGSDETVAIPETIDGMSVVSIGICGEGNMNGVTICIPDSVSNIHLDAIANRHSKGLFKGDEFSWVLDISVSESNPNLKMVDKVLFSKDMKTLLFAFDFERKKYAVPEGVERIAEYAFSREFLETIEPIPIALSSVTLPESLKAIEKHAFLNCTNLKKIAIPASVELIEDCAFSHDTTIKLTGAETELGQNVAGSIQINKTNKKYLLENGLLMDLQKKRLLKAVEVPTSFVMPETIEQIDDSAFRGCGLSSITLNNGLKRIGHNAFSDNQIKKIDVPATVESMEVDAFQGDNQLIRVSISPESRSYHYDGTAIYHIDSAGTYSIFDVVNKAVVSFDVSPHVRALRAGDLRGCGKLTRLMLHEGLESFDEKCLIPSLRAENKIERVYIPASVCKITFINRKSPFAGKIKYVISEENPYFFCDDDIVYSVDEDGNYTAVANQNSRQKIACINEGTVAIGENAFYCASGTEDHLAEVVLPSTLKQIGSGAFGNRSKLSSVSIPASLCEIADDAFAGCEKLKAFDVAEENGFYSSVDGVLTDKSTKTILIYPAGRKAARYEMPDSVETFGVAFAFTTGIQELVLSKNTKLISNFAFPHTCQIKRLIVQNDIREIDKCAFGRKSDYSARSKPIEIVCDPSFYIASYVQNDMAAPKQDVLVFSAGESPEVRRFKQMFLFKKVKDGLCITKYLDPEEIDGEPQYHLERKSKVKNNPELVIPAKIGDESVVELGKNMFGRLSYGIKSLVISEGIKRIGPSVLFGHSDLTKIVFPRSLEKISEWVFTDDNKQFKDVYLKGSELVIVVEEGSYAETFVKDYKFEKQPRIVVKGEGPGYLNFVKVKGGYLAKLQEGLEETDRIIVPNTYKKEPVKSLELINHETMERFSLRFASTYCCAYDDFPYYDYFPKAISALAIPDNIESIYGLQMLRFTQKCADGLPSISVADGNAQFWTDGIALYSKDKKVLLKLVDYTVEDYTVCHGTEKLSDASFDHCVSLKRIILPDSIQEIESNVFYGCQNLEMIEGSEKVAKVGNNAISRTAYERNAEYVIVGSTLIRYNGKNSKFIIPEGVEAIADGAFRTYSSWSTDVLEEIVFPNSIKSIGSSAFSGRNGIKEINLPEGLESIADGAFSNCSGVERISLPASLKSIGAKALPCDKDACVSEVVVADGNPYYVSEDNIIYTADRRNIVFVAIKADIKEFTVPDEVTSIASFVNANLERLTIKGAIAAPFRIKCINLKEVWISDEQKVIPASAFSGDKKLKRVTLGSGITEIGDYAFKETAIGDITLPEGIAHIGSLAFAETKLKTVHLPKSVKTLGWGAFSGCKEIEVYDSIDDEAKACDKGIDTDNGCPNSLVGYIGMGPARAMWDCAANHKWYDYTITVRSAETDDIKYSVWMGANPTQRNYYCFLSSAWGKNATFYFKGLDELFAKIRGTDHKVKVARLRLDYPVDLPDEMRKKYESYLKKYGKEA